MLITLEFHSAGEENPPIRRKES